MYRHKESLQYFLQSLLQMQRYLKNGFLGGPKKCHLLLQCPRVTRIL